MISLVQGRSSRANKTTMLLMGFYLLFSFVVLPLFSPLRNLGVMEPGLIRNALLPFVFVFLFMSVGLNNIIKPKSSIQILLLMMLLQSALVGLTNLFDGGEIRNYVSHLFQVSSAYLMLCVGWLMFDYWGERFWKWLVFAGLFSAFVSSFFTIGALGRGDIGRYYTAAYGFILISSFAAVASNKTLFLGFLGSFISNKRAVLLAVLTIIMSAFFNINRSPDKKLTYKKMTAAILAVVFVMLGFGLLIFSLMGWAENNPNTGLAKAVNISVGRLEQIVDAGDGAKTLNQISSGRIEEIQATMQSLDGLDYVVGSGAGWGVLLDNRKSVQNIHFTPLSLVAVYGAPYTVLLYGFIIFYLVRFYIQRRPRSITESMAPFYVIGALVHSFFAYSLFIDWAFFFFMGVLIRSGSLRGVAQEVSR